MSGWRLALAALACAVMGTCVAGGATARSATSGFEVPRSTTPKLDSRLAVVADEQASAGRTEAVAVADNEGLSSRAGRVGVVVVANPGASAAAQQAVAAAGGSVEAAVGDLSDALVPPSALTKLASDARIERVRAPFIHEVDAVDEGVALADADAWHTAGLTGTGVKVAIVDLGFAGYASLLGTSLPASVSTVDDCGGNFGTATEHGTAVAELIHQMAPAADLTLICVTDEVGLAQAEQYVVAHGIKIVSHSVSWFDTSRGDGTGEPGTPDAIVADARAHGVLWVNSAGNYRLNHWAGYFTPDASQPFVNDFDPGVTGEQFSVAAGGESCVGMKWDAWPVTTEDFDLVVKRVSDGVTVASSANDQANGPAPPVEEACFTNTSGSTVTYAASILKFSVANDPLIDLFVTGAGPIADPVTQSVTEPGSSADTLAVGAVCWQTGAFEWYSSVGPTIDGRTKPDIAADDSVSTDTYGAATPGSAGCGTSGFTGTSASTPQVAGAAALLLQQSPSATPADLTADLETRAQGLQQSNSSAVDNDETGHGPLALGPTDSIGTIAFDFSGGAYVTDGDAVSEITGYSQPVFSQSGLTLLAKPTGPDDYQSIHSDGAYTGQHLIETGSDASEPAWAPDERTIVFYRPSLGKLVKEDILTGPPVTQLAAAGANASPAWAPDNSKIAYLKTTSGATDLWTMNTDGTNQTQLTSLGDLADPTGIGGAIAWSPGSSKLLFVRGTGPYAIWVVDANGANAHALTSSGSAFAPAWSPDGTQIAFAGSGGSTIDVMSADGSNVHPLNPHAPFAAAQLRRLSWSSDTPAFPVHPINTSSITGAAVVGEQLETSVPAWIGTPGTTVTFQWARCQPSNLCNSIPNATDSTYTPTSADLGFYLRVQLDGTGVSGGFLSAPTDPVVSLWPIASAAPTISGSPTSGSTMSIATSGTWSGSPSFEYGWLRCGSSGGPCSTIAGADGSNYTLTCSDVGSTVRGTAFGENAGGFNASTSLPSPVVTGSTCPIGGGGSGSALPPNMRVQWSSVSNLSPAAGSEVDFVVAVDNHGGGNGNNAHLLFSLPSTMKLVGPPYYERGSGCVGTVSVDCNFNSVANGTSTIVKFGVTVSGSGAQSITATATADRESDPSDNSATVTLQVAGGSGPPPPPPPLPKPHKGKTINGTAGANRLTGTAYADVLNGRGGNDVLSGLGGNDTLNGGAGKDRLLGGAGNDLLIPGLGADTVFGGPGNDVVRARDKTVDSIDCGTGRDTVYADKHDKVAKNCEIVHRG
ncbi:MAG TPA: S8 family serine peptidase [Gaiellaceae bacterium]